MDMKDSVKMAIDNEVKGREMYLEFARRAKNPVTKRTFEYLADEELKHVDKIKELSESGKAPEMKAMSHEQVRTLFEQSISHFDRQVRPGSDDLEAHNVAMDLERKSVELYERLSKEAEDGKVREFFGKLAGEERIHFDLIQKAFNFISDPEGWYAGEEGRVMEG